MFGKLFKSGKQKEFWNWFIKHKEDYYHFEKNQNRLFNELSKKLKNVNEGFVFEFGPIRDDGERELCISADGNKKIFPDVIELIGYAPSLSNWKFSAFRQRTSENFIKIKFGSNVELSYDDIYFRYAEDENEKKLDIELNIRNYDPENRAIIGAIFILLDGLLGEYDMEIRVRAIDFIKLDEENIAKLHPFIHLRDLIDLLKV